MQPLQGWGRARFYRNLRDIGAMVPTGQQNDSFSCGVCWADAAMTEIWKDLAWSPDIAVARRLCWFVRLAQRSTDGATRSLVSMPSTSAVPIQRRIRLADLLNAEAQEEREQGKPVVTEDADSDTEASEQS